ncbi:hypothetical protein BO94DRAFT_628416 [Aspergillus sclerotioniger CBS 115572]|uniref:Uncharacterized protein n=1 Tax=Aspergillus sclerotioniger CBS 115572 TaxID=1450535 RepID=A0A317V746_9EURO|nr:hypothetical protein BO94DRAFT_628416 [Aspergillus sclerotioniger CBS 115572]PWY69845.1 hypothetical protein BO94DRAFT_628416 [Aspergillus sclerotioniger CBS 115572]
MPDRPSRRTLLGSPLQVLKSAFGGRHSRFSGNPDPQHRHRNSSRNHDVPNTQYSQPDGPPSHNSQPTVTEASSSSPPTRALRSVRGERVSRATMSPSTPDMKESFIQAEEGGHDNEDWISVHHEEESPTQRELPPVQSTNRKIPSALYSRLPTPVNPPTSDLYSHEIYQQEGRRNVLSSIGKRYTGIKHQGERNAYLEGSHTISSQQHQRDGMCDDSRPSEQQKTTSLRVLLRTDKIHGSERVPLRRTNVLPTISTTSISRIHDSGNPRRSLPVMVVGRPSTQIYSRKEVAQDRALKQASPNPSPSPIGVIAADGHSSHSEEEQKTGEDWQPHARDRPQMPFEKEPLRRIRWTSKFEDLRAQDSDNEDKEVRGAATTQSQDDERVSLTPQAQPNADAKPALETRLRHRERTDRMVSSPRGQPSSSSSSSSSSRIPAAASRNKPTLTVHTTGLSQVLEAQPREYWLGRLMTLTNAFHYEDSFQEPDVATGFGMLSSYSRPLGGSDGDSEKYRIKRAFMVLENVCVTDEASASLRQFRDERK